MGQQGSEYGPELESDAMAVNLDLAALLVAPNREMAEQFLRMAPQEV